MDSTTLIVGVITGALGMGYFVYGKKQSRMVPLFAGIGLCICPYFFDNIWITVAISVALAAAPFVIRA